MSLRDEIKRLVLPEAHRFYNQAFADGLDAAMAVDIRSQNGPPASPDRSEPMASPPVANSSQERPTAP